MIDGLVGALGANRFGFTLDGSSALRLDLEAWKVVGGPIEPSSLWVHLPTPEGAIDAALGRIGPFAVVRLRVRLDPLVPDVDGRPRRHALCIEEVEGAPGDPELMARAVHLGTERAEQHPLLGRLVLDRGSGVYRGRWGPLRRQVRVSVVAGADGELDRGRLEEALRQIRRDRRRWRVAIADEYFEEYAAERFVGPFGRARFLRKLGLVAVAIDPEGFQLSFDDGDVCGGHIVQVRFRAGAIDSVTLEG